MAERRSRHRFCNRADLRDGSRRRLGLSSGHRLPASVGQGSPQPLGGTEAEAAQPSVAEDDLERENAELRREIDVLRARVQKLRNDPAAVEQLARDELGLIRHSEVVYQFPK